MRVCFLIVGAMAGASCTGKAPEVVEPLDADADGYARYEDCEDRDAAIHPDAVEVCNGVDDNCDDVVDVDAIDQSTWYPDTDGDSYGDASQPVLRCAADAGQVPQAGDCDDTRGDVHPGAPEVCNDVDDDCDGGIDGDEAIDPPTWYVDNDGDGFGDNTTASVACDPPAGGVGHSGDCDDTDPSISPAAPERCNTVDDDCDATTDDPEAVSAVAADGTTTDVTESFAAGTAAAPATVDVEGDLLFCGGTWYVHLHVRADARLVGREATLDGGGSGSVVRVEEDNLVVSVEALTLANGEGSAVDRTFGYRTGGAVACTGASRVELVDVVARDSTAELGGAVFSQSCDLTLRGSTLSGNYADFGGGIFAFGGSVVLEGTTVEANDADVAGGGIGMEGVDTAATLLLEDSVVEGNAATYGGGVSLLYTVAAQCTGSSAVRAGVLANSASELGSGVLLYDEGEGASFESVECDFGTATDGDDNVYSDVTTNAGEYTYELDATFACTSAGCG